MRGHKLPPEPDPEPFTKPELFGLFARARILADCEPDGLLADALRHLAQAATAVERNAKRLARGGGA